MKDICIYNFHQHNCLSSSCDFDMQLPSYLTLSTVQKLKLIMNYDKRRNLRDIEHYKPSYISNLISTT